MRPGALISDVANVSFEPYIRRGVLTDADSRSMPYNWSAGDDGAPLKVPQQYVPNPDWEAMGRRITHVWPATKGPRNPKVGHSVSMPKMPPYNIQSNKHATLEEGMTFVLHSQWLDPLTAGANIGDCYLVTDNGAENLSCHVPLGVHRIPA